MKSKMGKVAEAVARKVSPRKSSKLKKAGKLAAVAAVVVGTVYAGRKIARSRSKKSR